MKVKDYKMYRNNVIKSLASEAVSIVITLSHFDKEDTLTQIDKDIISNTVLDFLDSDEEIYFEDFETEKYKLIKKINDNLKGR